MPENTDDIPQRASFGFDADFGDLSSVKPTGAPKPKPAPKAVKATPRKAKPKPAVKKAQDALADRLAKSQGFTSREAAPVLMKKRRRVQHDEPVDQLSIRGPVRVLNGFIDFCEENKLSYWEGMEQLVAQAK
ncbi:hypothetical protein [Litorimonas sp. WD9-15]|uniref:hypothetical protein n=1 Tax=Litorimonas sp. WD9-15 TaxID=3418716 RepID=UPI003D08BA6A